MGHCNIRRSGRLWQGARVGSLLERGNLGPSWASERPTLEARHSRRQPLPWRKARRCCACSSVQDTGAAAGNRRGCRAPNRGGGGPGPGKITCCIGGAPCQSWICRQCRKFDTLQRVSVRISQRLNTETSSIRDALMYSAGNSRPWPAHSTLHVDGYGWDQGVRIVYVLE